MAEVPRVKDEKGQTETVAVPWAEKFSRFTRCFEAFGVEVLPAMNVETLLAFWTRPDRALRALYLHLNTPPLNIHLHCLHFPRLLQSQQSLIKLCVPHPRIFPDAHSKSHGIPRRTVIKPRVFLYDNLGHTGDRRLSIDGDDVTIPQRGEIREARRCGTIMPGAKRACRCSSCLIILPRADFRA